MLIDHDPNFPSKVAASRSNFANAIKGLLNVVGLPRGVIDLFYPIGTKGKARIGKSGNQFPEKN